MNTFFTLFITYEASLWFLIIFDVHKETAEPQQSRGIYCVFFIIFVWHDVIFLNKTLQKKITTSHRMCHEYQQRGQISFIILKACGLLLCVFIHVYFMCVNFYFTQKRIQVLLWQKVIVLVCDCMKKNMRPTIKKKSSILIYHAAYDLRNVEYCFC